jgi:hypothetical protein
MPLCRACFDCHISVNGHPGMVLFDSSHLWCMFFPEFCSPAFSHGCNRGISASTATMFDKLKNKWKVSGLQLGLIIATFAIGGSLTGFAGKKIMNLLAVQQDWLWAIIYIVLITILWPLAVLLVSIPFGQFSFFIKYIRKIGAKMGFGKRKG